MGSDAHEWHLEQLLSPGPHMQRLDDPGSKLVSNQLCVKGLEHALQVTLSWKLKDYTCEDRVTPLARAEHRYYVTEPAELLTEGRVRRACVENTDTQERRVEVSDAFIATPRVHFTSDRGTVGWQMLFWMFQQQHLHGSFQLDEAHKDWCTATAAIEKCGLRGFRLAVQVLLNLAAGPFGGAALLSKIKGAAEEYFQHADENDSLYLTFFERLAREHHNKCEALCGTSEHMTEVLSQTRQCPFYKRKGAVVKQVRWFHFFDRAGELLPWWDSYALILVYLSKLSGIITHTSDLEEMMAQVQRSSTVTESASGGKTMMRDAQKEEMAWLRKKNGNLHVAVSTAANPLNKHICQMMVSVMATTRKHHGFMLKAMDTQAGAIERHTRMCHSDYLVEVRELAGLTCNEKVLEEMGFEVRRNKHALEVLEPEDQMTLASMTLRFVLALMGERLLKNLMFPFAMPYALAGLVSEDGETVTGTLRKLAKWLRVLEAVERDGHEHEVLRKMLSELVWPRLCWYRSVLVRLSERDFKTVPADVHKEILYWLRGFQSSVPVERVFQVCRAYETKAGGKLSRERRWVTMSASDVLADSDRKRIGTEAADMDGAVDSRRFRKEVFEADLGRSSLAEVTDIAESAGSYRSPAAEPYGRAHMAWMALQYYNKKGVAVMRNLWLSLLCVPLAAVRRTMGGEVVTGVVVESNEWGVLLWRTHQVEIGGHTYYYLQTDDGGGYIWKFSFVEDLSSWEASAMSAQIPTELNASGLRLCFTCDCWEPLLHFAARRAFPQLTVPLLQKLMTHLGMSFGEGNKKPTVLREVLRAIIVHVLGAISHAAANHHPLPRTMRQCMTQQSENT
eukprot:6466628-Amphidinium_carterae.2